MILLPLSIFLLVKRTLAPCAASSFTNSSPRPVSKQLSSTGNSEGKQACTVIEPT